MKAHALFRSISLGALVALGLVQAASTRAEACGAFFRPRDMERAPSLSLERVLIVHDPKTQTEHFIREVVFRGGRTTFGFVVPTPSRPEVFKVKQPPFDKLDTAFPFAPMAQSMEGGGSKGASRGGPPGGAPPVIILEIKKIGSFTAFVLKATDATALGKWLTDNKLGSTPENDAWLAEYVKRDFYYVAFRYEPSKEKVANELSSETVRISFKTPAPFYPYREPKHPAGSLSSDPRAVAMWVVSPEALAPVALAKDNGKDLWVKPFQEGMRAQGIQGATLRLYLGDDEDKLIGDDTTYFVQPFEDQKRNRIDYGDVVFLPEKGVAESARADVAKMVKSLLVGGGK